MHSCKSNRICRLLQVRLVLTCLEKNPLASFCKKPLKSNCLNKRLVKQEPASSIRLARSHQVHALNILTRISHSPFEERV